jgi:hypothetical protein
LKRTYSMKIELAVDYYQHWERFKIQIECSRRIRNTKPQRFKSHPAEIFLIFVKYQRWER